MKILEKIKSLKQDFLKKYIKRDFLKKNLSIQRKNSLSSVKTNNFFSKKTKVNKINIYQINLPKRIQYKKKLWKKSSFLIIFFVKKFILLLMDRKNRLKKLKNFHYNFINLNLCDSNYTKNNEEDYFIYDPKKNPEKLKKLKSLKFQQLRKFIKITTKIYSKNLL